MITEANFPKVLAPTTFRTDAITAAALATWIKMRDRIEAVHGVHQVGLEVGAVGGERREESEVREVPPYGRPAAPGGTCAPSPGRPVDVA